MGVQLEKQIRILSNLHKYRMTVTENQLEVIIQLTPASDLPIKETTT